MTTLKLRWVKAYTDRHGRRRHYFRRPGDKSVALPGLPGSREFMEAYQAAMDGAAPRSIGEDRIKPGSFSALIALYYRSAEFTTLGEITQKNYRLAIERFRKEHGRRPVKTMTREHVGHVVDATPTFRRYLRMLLNFAVDRGWRASNPMLGMRRPRTTGDGYRAWTQADLAAYEAKWPTGSRERLALALLLYTAQRRADVVTMGRQHVKGGKIHVAQSKSGGRTKLWIPIHPRLKAEIDAAPKDNMTFLVTQYGQPFTPAGFTNWFRDKAHDAGLPLNSSPHGLRKASAAMLAEAGCSANQIMAVTGHKNLSEVSLYTAAADQERLAVEAMAMTERRTSVSTNSERVDKSGENS